MSNSKWRQPANAAPKPPAIDPSIPKQETPPKAEDTPKPAEQAARPKSSLSDQEAIEIMDLGVKFLHNFLSLGVSALARLRPEQVKQVIAEEPEPSHTSPQKRPRGRMHSILLMFKFGIASVALLPRILKVTHPHLFPKGGGNRETTATATEKFVAALKQAMPAT
jgi:hypothetical protein